MGSFAQMLIYEYRRDTATSMLLDRFTIAAVARYSRLPVETVQELAFELGVIPPDTPLGPQFGKPSASRCVSGRQMMI